MTGRADRAVLERVRTALAPQAGMPAQAAVYPQAGGGDPLPSRTVTMLANVKQVPVCAECGLGNPPPDRSCDHGALVLYHHVGYVDGCAGCGRLAAACDREPCSARTGGLLWGGRQ